MAWCQMGTKPLTASVIRRVRYETNQSKAAVATHAINTLPIRYRPTTKIIRTTYTLAISG